MYRGVWCEQNTGKMERDGYAKRLYAGREGGEGV